MLSRLGIESYIAEQLVRAFTEETLSTIRDIEKEYDMGTGNFKHGGAWDIRFERIKRVALQNELVVVTKKRGLWTFSCILDLGKGSLYIFSKEKNLEEVISKFGKNKLHYFHAFVSVNSGPREFEPQQVTLFESITEDYETRRLEEVQKILGEDYPRVNQVIFVVAKEFDGRIFGAEARLYNRYFEEVDNLDWSHYVAKEGYSHMLNSADEAIDETPAVIPKLKNSIKKQKDQEFAKKKKVQERFKEDGKS